MTGSTRTEWLEGIRSSLRDPLDELLTAERHCLMRYADSKDGIYLEISEELAQAVSQIISVHSRINDATKGDEE